MGSLKLRSQFLIIFLVLSVLPLILFGTVVYQIVEDAITRQAEEYFVQSVEKERVIIDHELDYIAEFSQKLNIDERIYQIFSKLDTENALELKKASNQINAILNSYKPWGNNIYSTHLMTSYYRFGEEDKNYYPQGSFYESELAVRAREARGKLVWIPTYDYLQMFQIETLTREQIEYGSLFSAVRQMNVCDVSSGRVKRLGNGQENPILVVNFQEEFLLSLLQKYGEGNKAQDIYYMILSTRGNIVCSTNEAFAGGDRYQEDWFSQLGEEIEGGCCMQKIEGRRYLITYSKSEITGWLVAAFVPVRELIREINGNILKLMLAIMSCLVILSFVCAVLVSDYLNRKIYRLLTMVNRIGEGDFDTVISFHEQDEFSFFYQGINQMSRNLQKLIHENYEVKLQQRDFEVMILNIQLNPHFLYNTLNMINWICLEGDMERAGNMIVELSRMLQYTSQNKKQTVLLKDDLAWLERYILIMKKRFEHEFQVSFSIEEELLTCEVPKLFLQPLIENAIVHGFKNLDRVGVLEVSAHRSGNKLVFLVEDNGNGMSGQRIQEVMSDTGTSIGVANTDRRIKILYGEESGITIESQLGEGTLMIVTIPDTNAKDRESFRT